MLFYDRDGTGMYQDDGIYRVRIDRCGDGRWYVKSWFAGHRERTYTGERFRRQDEAEAFAALLWRDYITGTIRAPDPAPLTLGELVDRFCARTHSRRGEPLSPSTARSNRTQIQSLVHVAGRDCPIFHVSAAHVRAAVARPPAQRSKAQYLRAIRAMIRWAVRRGWLGVDVTADIHVGPGPIRMKPFLQPTEIQAFLDAAPPSTRIRGGFIIYTGLRVGEARHARWDWLPASIGMPTLHIPADDPAIGWRTKSHAARPIPLVPQAVEFVEAAREKWGDAGWLLHDRPKPPLQGNWSRDVRIACKRAGVTVVGIHGLRRTAGVLWLTAGLDIYRVSKLLGHSSVTVTEQAYAGIGDGRLAREMEAVGRALAAPVLGMRKKRRESNDA